MSTFLRKAKSETREMAEADRLRHPGRRVNEPTEWHMSSSVFFAAFVVIAGGIAVLALVLR